MELSGVIARVISIIYICSGIGIIIKKIDFGKIADEILASPVMTFISGVIGIVPGTILVQLNFAIVVLISADSHDRKHNKRRLMAI